MFKNVKILEFGDYIWNHHEKCIEISTNMPGIGLEILRILLKIRFCMDGETNGRVQSINICCCYAHYYNQCLPFSLQKNNYSVNNADFRTQEPEHFDDIVTAVRDSYVTLRGETKIAPEGDVPSNWPSGHEALSSAEDFFSQGTGDEINYHAMSPTGLAPCENVFDIVLQGDNEMSGEMTRSPVGSLENENNTVGNVELHYLTMPPSEAWSDDIDNDDDNELLSIDSTPPLANRWTQDGAITANNGYMSMSDIASCNSHDEAVDETQKLSLNLVPSRISNGISVPHSSQNGISDPYVSHTSWPKTPTLVVENIGMKVKDMEAAPEVLQSNRIRLKDKVVDKTSAYVSQSPIPLTRCQDDPYVLHSPLPGKPATRVNTTSTCTGDKDSSVPVGNKSRQAALGKGIGESEDKMKGDKQEEITPYVQSAYPWTVHVENQEASG